MIVAAIIGLLATMAILTSAGPAQTLRPAPASICMPADIVDQPNETRQAAVSRIHKAKGRGKSAMSRRAIRQIHGELVAAGKIKTLR